MAKKDDEKKVEEDKEKSLPSDEEEKGSLFEDEPEGSDEPKKKSVEDIVNSKDSAEDETLEDDLDDEDPADVGDEEDVVEEPEHNAEALTSEGDGVPTESVGKDVEVKTEEEVEEEADKEFQAGIPSEGKKDKKVKKNGKKKGLLKKVFIATLILFVLLLGTVAGVWIYGLLTAKEESKTEQTQIQPEENTVQEETSKEIYVTAEDGLNLREEPDADGKLIVTMPYGTKLTVLDEQNDWYQVEYNGQEGWCAKLYTSEEKPEVLWKTYTGTGFDKSFPKFSIKYPSDWILSGYKVTKTDGGKKYTVAFGEGGHGFAEGDASVTSAQENVTYNGFAAKKTIAKKGGKIILIVTQFTKGNDYTNIEFSPPTGYDESYLETYEKMLKTFKYL